ncbi:MAG: Omp28-related outer membrane protein [Saprospiraceae bacterium]
MKKSLIVLCLLTYSLFAQAQVKNYPLIEHYTNTKCPSCAGNNPTFYTKTLPFINSSVHHISYHPSFPYPTCELYLANTSENNARAAFNGANYTPSYVLNGGSLQSVTTLTITSLNAEILKTSPIELKVKEISAGSNLTANIKLKTYGDVGSSKYKLMVALCEKTLAYNAPNGEKTHYDVFRKMLTSVNGNDIVAMPAVGNETEFNFNYELNSKWNAAQMYVLAWVVNADTKAVLNSGSKFTSLVSNDEVALADGVQVYPNPANQVLNIDLSDDKYMGSKYELIHPSGQVLREGKVEGTKFQISISDFEVPYFIVKINGPDGIFATKVAKQ